jgi:superfamily I DNA and/or RNA helicase
MPLIIKGNKQPEIVSKQEIVKKIEEDRERMTAEETALAQLPAEVAERRREIIAAKRHREFMAKVQQLEEAAALRHEGVQATEEIIIETGDAINIQYDDVVKVSIEEEPKTETPDFESMTKKELDEWAEATLGLTLDRRKKKADMIETIKNSL